MKRVVITGATRGLGLAITRQALHADYSVIAIGRKITPELKFLIEKHGNRCVFEHFDFDDLKEIRNFFVKSNSSIWTTMGTD